MLAVTIFLQVKTTGISKTNEEIFIYFSFSDHSMKGAVNAGQRVSAEISYGIYVLQM